MKGTVFVELIRMAETAFGEDAVDAVLDKADLESGGAYTTVGNYPCSELVKIVEGFSAASGLSTDDLQRQFGHWMLKHFGEKFPATFFEKADSMAMLESIDGEIHVEVRKLYPDAELPRFETERLSDSHLKIIYTSPRPLVAFCHGLIEACVERFGETADIVREQSPSDRNSTIFQVMYAR